MELEEKFFSHSTTATGLRWKILFIINQRKRTFSFLGNNKDYLTFLDEAKAKISAAQVHAARSLNSGIMTLYWDLGNLIVDKQKIHGWGDSVVRRLALDLSRDLHAGKSFSSRNLWFMRQMFLEYGQTGIPAAKVKQAVSLLGPTNIILPAKKRF
ncbi:MAG: DUF1016 N-terminal domain-containing protein [Chitinivibrionales bacterium]|nr:DUF1016 N-terminal domain-containing protein [Chitinivibrionales bacterium]